MDSWHFPCEITFVRGTPVITPRGTDYLLRPRFPEGANLPDHIPNLDAQLGLRIRAEAVVPETDVQQRLTPKEGMPTRAVGVLLDRRAPSSVLLDVGFPVEIILPDGTDLAAFKTGDCLACQLTPDIDVIDLSVNIPR